MQRVIAKLLFVERKQPGHKHHTIERQLNPIYLYVSIILKILWIYLLSLNWLGDG